MDNEQLRATLLNSTAAVNRTIDEAVKTRVNQLLQVQLEEIDKRSNSVIVSERKLAKWKAALVEESKSLGCMEADLNAEQLHLARERSKIDTEKQDLAKEKGKISSEKEQLAKEKDKISSEKEQLAKEKDKISSEKESLEINKSKIAKEKESLAKERNEIAKARQAVYEVRLEAENLLEKNQSMLTTLEEKEQKLKRKDAVLEEKRNALTAREKENSAKEQKLAEERKQWQSLMRSGTDDLGRRVGREGTIALVAKPTPIEEFSLRGWMKFDDFFADLSRLGSIFNVSFETFSAIKRLIGHMQDRKKIVNGVIKLDQNGTFITITIGQVGADRLIKPIVVDGSPHGLDSTLRALYNNLLNKARQSSEASTMQANNDEDSDGNQET